jgi:hypothetical protein
MPALGAYTDDCRFLQKNKHREHSNYSQELHVEFSIILKDTAGFDQQPNALAIVNFV